MSCYEIKGNLFFWISSFLSGRSQRVKINSSLSSPCQVTSGVCQGSVLGPLLFNVFINDVTDSLDPSTTAKLFADDIKLYSSFSNISPSNLQNQLNIIQLWSSTWQLKISHSKCNILPIGPHSTNNTFHIDNIAISIVEHSIDLGITIDSKLSFHNHINNIVCRANQRKYNCTGCLYGFVRVVLIGLPRFFANTASHRVRSSDLSFSHSTSHRWQTSSHHTGSVIFSMPMTHNCTSHWTKMNPLKYFKIVLTRFIPGLPRTDCHLIRRSRKQSYSGQVRGWDARIGSHPCRLLKQLSAYELAWRVSVWRLTVVWRSMNTSTTSVRRQHTTSDHCVTSGGSSMRTPLRRSLLP